VVGGGERGVKEVAIGTPNIIEVSGLDLRLDQDIFLHHTCPDRPWVPHIDLYKG